MKPFPFSPPRLLTSSPHCTPPAAQAPRKVPRSRVEGGQAAWQEKQKLHPLPPDLPIKALSNQNHLHRPSCLQSGRPILPAHQSPLKILQIADHRSSTALSHLPRVLSPHPITVPQSCRNQQPQRSFKVLSPPLSLYPPDSLQCPPPRPKARFSRVPTNPPFPCRPALPPHPRQSRVLPLSTQLLRDRRHRRQNHRPSVSLPCQVEDLSMRYHLQHQPVVSSSVCYSETFSAFHINSLSLTFSSVLIPSFSGILSPEPDHVDHDQLSRPPSNASSMEVKQCHTVCHVLI